MDPARREMFPDWERSSRLMAAKFRADSAHHIGDPAFEQLIATLRKSSPEFCKLWKQARGRAVRRGAQGPSTTRSSARCSSSTPSSTPRRRPSSG